jgi:hypothetical protein
MKKPFEIQKNVPIPPKWWRKRKYEEILKALKVGDSFTVEGLRIGSVNSAIDRWRIRLGIETTCRTENGVVRVWRTK